MSESEPVTVDLEVGRFANTIKSALAHALRADDMPVSHTRQGKVRF